MILNQKDNELELEVQKLAKHEQKEFEELEQKWTDEDLIFAWAKGYEARVQEEREGVLWWTTCGQ